MVRGLFWVTGCYTGCPTKKIKQVPKYVTSTTRIRDDPGTNRIEKCIPHQEITGQYS